MKYSAEVYFDIGQGENKNGNMETLLMSEASTLGITRAEKWMTVELDGEEVSFVMQSAHRDADGDIEYWYFYAPTHTNLYMQIFND